MNTKEFLGIRKQFLKNVTLAKRKMILTQREVDIIRLRVGKGKTVPEVAKIYDVTQERIRIVEQGVLDKLIVASL